MKIIHTIILVLACNCTQAQTNLLTNISDTRPGLIRPINESIVSVPGNTIKRYVAVEVNKRVFAHVFFKHWRQQNLSSTTAHKDFLKYKPLSFKQADINNHFRTISGNPALDNIADITGSILDTFLLQYTTQK